MKIIKSGFIRLSDTVLDKWYAFTDAQHLTLPSDSNLNEWYDSNIQNWSKLNETNNQKNMPPILQLNDNTKFCGCVSYKLVSVYKVEVKPEVGNNENLFFALNLENFIKILVNLWCQEDMNGLLKKQDTEIMPLISILNKIYIAQMNPITHQLWSNEEIKLIIETYIKSQVTKSENSTSNARKIGDALGVTSPELDAYNNDHEKQAFIRNKAYQYGNIGYYIYVITSLMGVSLPLVYAAANILLITNAFFNSIKIYNTDGLANKKQLSNLSMLFMLTSHSDFFTSLNTVEAGSQLLPGGAPMTENLSKTLSFGYLDLELIGLGQQETVPFVDKVYRFLIMPISGFMNPEKPLEGLNLDSIDTAIKDGIEGYIDYFELEIFKPEIRNKINDYYAKIPDIHNDDLVRKLESCNFSGKLEDINILKLLEQLKVRIESHKTQMAINSAKEMNQRKIEERNEFIKTRMHLRKAKRKEKIEEEKHRQEEAYNADRKFYDAAGLKGNKIKYVTSREDNNPTNQEWAKYYSGKLSTDITNQGLIDTINGTFGTNCGSNIAQPCISNKNRTRAGEIIQLIRNSGGLVASGGSRKKTKKRISRNNKKKSLKKRRK